MLKRLAEARLVAPLIAAFLGLALLAGLGMWQLQRAAWKEGLLAALATRTKADPVPLAEALRRWKSGEDVNYLRVKAKGRFLHERELYLYAPSPEEGPGYHVYTPMVVFSVAAGDNGQGPVSDADFLIVNRGYVPEALRDPQQRREGLVNDTPITVPVVSFHQGQINGAEVIGLLRHAEEKSLFTPAHDPVADTWYARDLVGMSQAVVTGLCPEGARRDILCGKSGYPFFLDLEASDVPGGWPRGGVTIVTLPNRHLEYALTWFGLAATLAGVFLVFARQRLKGAGP